jgi:hypothetical protein
LALAAVGNREVAASNPTLSLATSAGDVRMLSTSTPPIGWSYGTSAISVIVPGTVSNSFTLAGTAAGMDSLQVQPSSGVIAPEGRSSISYSFRWTDYQDLGSRSGLITLTDKTSGTVLTMPVTGAVVAERSLTAGSLGTAGTAGIVRVIAGANVTASAIDSGNTAASLDSEATRVKTVPGGKATGSNVAVTYANPGAGTFTFNGINQSVPLDVVFAKPGLSSGTLNLAPKLLANGETSAVVGVQVQPVVLSYNVDALVNRTLGVGGVPSRVVVGSGDTAMVQTTISSGSGTANDDSHATRLAIDPTASVTAAGVDVAYAGTPAFSMFDASSQTAALDVTFTGVGLHTGSLNLAPANGTGLVSNGEAAGVGATLQPATFNYNTAVLQNRTLTVGALPSLRVMVDTPIPTTISSNSIAPNGITIPGLDDSSATRVAVKLGTAKNTDVSVTYAAGTSSNAVFNGPNETQKLNVTFLTTGTHATGGTLNLAPSLLANGEIPSKGGASGAVVQPAVLNYAGVTAVEQRKLVVGTPTVTFNNVLLGSYVGVTVNSTNTNPDSNHTTSVVVAPAGASIGPVTILPTTISNTGAEVYGRLTQYTTGSKTAVSGSVAVKTAEAASVGDTKPYPNLTFKYAAGDVGIAALGNSALFAGGSNGAFGPALTGLVPQGFTLGSFTASPSAGGTTYSSSPLASRVNSAGTLAGGGTTMYGPVGSEAQILDSTTVGADTTVSMQWRPRSAYESGQPGSTAPPVGALPSGIAWLTSDVVRVGMSPAPSGSSPVVYAVQMSFDNRINQQLDGGATALQEFQKGSLYLADLTPGGKWENIGNEYNNPGAKTGVNESLADFLNQELAGLSPIDADAMLRSLVGSWGVDTTPGQYSAWAIMNHGGTLAVVPEPASLMLLIPAGVAVVFYCRRRNRGGGKRRQAFQSTGTAASA